MLTISFSHKDSATAPYPKESATAPYPDILCTSM